MPYTVRNAKLPGKSTLELRARTNRRTEKVTRNTRSRITNHAKCFCRPKLVTNSSEIQPLPSIVQTATEWSLTSFPFRTEANERPISGADATAPRIKLMANPNASPHLNDTDSMAGMMNSSLSVEVSLKQAKKSNNSTTTPPINTVVLPVSILCAESSVPRQ